MDNRFFTKSQQVGEKSKILCTFRNCFNNYVEVFGRLLRMVVTNNFKQLLSLS